MATLVLQILSEGTPVDKREEDEEGRSCPMPTRDPELNSENKQRAVSEASYRDPADSGAFRADEVCGNCGAFDQTEDMLECIGDTSGEKGYCQLFRFVCSADHTCDRWVSGGPITDDSFDYGDNL